MLIWCERVNNDVSLLCLRHIYVALRRWCERVNKDVSLLCFRHIYVAHMVSQEIMVFKRNHDNSLTRVQVQHDARDHLCLLQHNEFKQCITVA